MIIGLCGYSKTGKDTLASQMEEYNRVAFADSLKCECQKMLKSLGIEVDLFEADKEEYRDMLVFWGAFKRREDINYWVKKVILKLAGRGDDRIIITDVRYPNEVAWILKRGGIVVGITRPGTGPANHEEATTISDIRIQWPNMPWISNDGTPVELEKALRKQIRAWFKENYSDKAKDVY